MLHQVSIFAENRKGTFQAITQLLCDNSINILGSVTNDSAEYGIVRMVVDKPELALEILSKAGYLAKSQYVLGVELDDRVGALNTLLLAMQESNINVNYIYLCFNRKSGRPVLVIHTEDVSEVEECISMKGFNCVNADSVK